MPHSGSSRSVERGFASLPKVFKLISQWPLFLALTLPGLNQACGPYGGGPTPGKTTPTITWATPAAITYGTALSSTQLDATASVPGTFTYTPAASTVLTAGTQTLSVSFAPTDTTHYNSASATVSLTVNKAAPTITWATPAAIAVGAALSATQLDATASVAGTFAYNPASGTVPAAGTQTLSVTFTPTDSTDYTTATDSVSLTVNAVSGSGIGPAGGTVHGFYGASVTVPAGALSTSVDIEIPRDDINVPALPTTGVDAAGAIYALTPHGTSFATPATIQIPFDSDRIPTDATPVLYKAESGGSFAPIPTTVNGNMLSADVSNFSWVIPGYAATLPRVVYGLTFDSNFKLNVSSFKITKGSGALSTATSSAPVGNGAISVTVHPSRRFLYVTNGTSSVPGSATNVLPNSISVYQLDATTGNISGPTDTQLVNGNPISVVVHPTGKFIYVVNEVRFGSPIGNISLFSIDPDTGALSGPITTGDSLGAPATAIAFAPSGEFAYVTYLHAVSTPAGNTFWDTVKTYSVSTTSGQLSASPIGSANTGDNPWTMAVTRSGKFAYVGSLSTQGSVSRLSQYSINQTTGVLTLQNSFDTINAVGSIAMDSESRFLYVGLQGVAFVPALNSNVNLEVYSIDSGGGLTLKGGVLVSNNPGNPISVTADPQGEFVFVLDSGGKVVPFAVNPTTGALTPGTAASGIFLGGSTGGVGDPFQFAVSGTSPVWQNYCNVQVNDAYVFDGCLVPHMSSGPGSTSGGTGGIGGGAPSHPPASSFTLSVSIGPTGGSIVSSPAGIDDNPAALNEGFVAHGFPTGTTVFLTATPPNDGQVYDSTWSGSCSGDELTTSVTMSQNQSCHVDFTLTSLRE
ncbi:MAG TPA: beta-propeller fold lactonase family protein [Terriglobales bacterium]